MSSAFEILQGAEFFTKLDLRNAYHLVFFSHKFLLAERNYDVGNWELLAIRLALGERHHSLETATVPFEAWTDHCSLTYIRTAKRLNAQQSAVGVSWMI